MTHLFYDAPVVHAYTRAEAIEDGVLVDVTETAREAGFRVPVALTRGVWTEAVEWDEANGAPQDEDGRLWDVLWMAWVAARGRRNDDRLTYEVFRIPNEPRATVARRIELVLHIGPGDEGEPVVTVMLPGED
jgi:hypothetical protein